MNKFVRGLKSRQRLIAGSIGLIGFFGLLASLSVILLVQIPSIPFIRTINTVPPHPDAVVILGAGIEPSGAPSDALVDRLIVGEHVSRALRAPMLLSADGGRFRRPEIASMHAWLLNHGVAPDRMVIDEEGFRTYESCKRAAQIYRLKRIVLITQRFHLGRAIYLCRSFGLETYGVPANLRGYKKDPWFVARDILASVKAWLDVHFIKPESPV